jgi:hypothetical protein
MGISCGKLTDCRQSGHSGWSKKRQQKSIRFCKERPTFSLAHPTIQSQQNMCPQSVAHPFVLSSKQSVHFLPSLISSGIAPTSRMVPWSSSARMGGLLSGSRTLKIDERGRSSRNASDDASGPAVWLSFPDISSERSAVILRKRRCEISR